MADSRVVKKRLNDSYRCGYCRQHFIKLKDPRTLPCLHVYCMSCLKTDIGYRKTHIKCVYCGEIFHDITDPTALPVAKFGDPIEYRSPPKPPLIPCDVCEGKTRAVVFCVEIQRKLCTQHQENHEKHLEMYMSTRHQFIPIDVYTASPQRYTITNCEHHEHHQLIEACSECHQIFCVRCDSKSDCKEGRTTLHHITPLLKLSSEMRKTLTDKISTLSEKISVLNDMSKDAWKELSELEEDAKKMITRVDDIANAKIENIRKQHQNIKEEILEYQRSCTKIVDEYLIDLALENTLVKKEVLASAQRMNEESNVAAIIKGYKSINKQIEHATDISAVEKYTVLRKVLVPIQGEDSLGLKLVNVGTPPNFLQSDEISGGIECETINFTVDGHMMCRTIKGIISVANTDTLNAFAVVKHTNTTCWKQMIQPGREVIASCYNWKDKSAEVILLDPNTLQKARSLYKRPAKAHTAYRIAQLHGVVYIVDYREKQLVVYLLSEDVVQRLSITDMKDPRPICVLPDSTILIGDHTTNGRVSRYKVENTTLIELWKFPHISDPTGISFDPTSELIYICTSEGVLFIISLHGTLVKFVEREDLGVRTWVHDVAVYRDKVFLGCGDGGLRRYTMKY